MTSTPRSAQLPNGIHRVAAINGIARRATSMTREASATGTAAANDDDEREEDPIHLLLRSRFEDSQAALASLFSGHGASTGAIARQEEEEPEQVKSVPVKKAARVIDEDDYGDDGLCMAFHRF